MHWDGSVSVGNILTFLGMVAFILGAAHRFAAQQKEQHHTMTAALNKGIIYMTTPKEVSE